MPKGFFVTGTDTGVGKTVLSGALLRAARMEGRRVCGMKPIETGCRKEGGLLIPADGLFLKNLSGTDEPMEHVAPCRFEFPLAPMVAAEMEGVDISLKRLRNEFGYLSERYDTLVVEGIGGLLVPIKKDYFVSDLARDFGLPLVVVATAFVGTINHTLLTLEHARRAGLLVAGVVINHPRPTEGGLAEETNPDVIEKLAHVPLIGVMPFLEAVGAEALDRAAKEHLDLGLLRKHL
jgi:dethiobiotin synthetase